MKSCGPKWLKNSRWNPEGSKNLTDCRVGCKRPTLRLTSMAARIATKAHHRFVFSFHRASEDAATATRSAQFPPNINPERAAAHSQAVPLGAESRKRCLRLLTETEGRSRAAATSAATNINASGRISNKWKMCHQEVP